MEKFLIQKQNHSLHITINIVNCIHPIHGVPEHINLILVKKFLDNLVVILIHHWLVFLNFQVSLKLLYILKEVLLILLEIPFFLLDFFNLMLGPLPLWVVLEKCSCSSLLLWYNWQVILTYNWNWRIVREQWQTQASLIQWDPCFPQVS